MSKISQILTFLLLLGQSSSKYMEGVIKTTEVNMFT